MSDWKNYFVEQSKNLKMDMVSFNDNHPCGGSEASRNLERALRDFIQEMESEDK